MLGDTKKFFNSSHILKFHRIRNVEFRESYKDDSSSDSDFEIDFRDLKLSSKPRRKGELCEDVLGHIFLFLQSRELLRVGAVSKTWNYCSNLNYIWKKLLHRTRFPFVEKRVVQDSDCKKEFLRCLKESKNYYQKIKKCEKNLKRVNWWSYWARILYGRVTPCSILVGVFCAIFFFSFLATTYYTPFGVFVTTHYAPAGTTNVYEGLFWYISLIPFVFCIFPCLFILFLSLYIDTNCFTKLRKRYNSILKTSKTKFDDRFFVNIVKMIVTGLTFYPVMVFCMYVSNSIPVGVPYTASLIPLYIQTTLFFCFPVFNNMKKIFCRCEIDGEDILLFLFAIPLIIVNLIVTIQCTIVALKWDSVIPDFPGVYAVILIPTWLAILCVWMIFPCCCIFVPICALTGFEDMSYLAGCIGVSGLICSIVLCPVIVFLVLLVLTFSSVISIPIFISFFACWVFAFPCCFISCLVCFIKPKNYFIL